MSSVWISLMFPHGFAFVTGILYRWYSIFPKASNLEVYGERKKVKLLSRARLFATPWIVACTKLLCPWDFQGKSTGVGCHFLLQGIFPTQGSNPALSHCRQMLYRLSHQGSRYSSKDSSIRHSSICSQKRLRSLHLCCLFSVISYHPPCLFFSSSHIGSIPSYKVRDTTLWDNIVSLT